MPRFDLDQLHSFVMISTCGSITAAATMLHRSPSAISEQMQKLEMSCHAILLHRTKRGISLTAAGEKLLPLARDLLTLNERAMAEMLEHALHGHLNIGITDYFLPHTIAPLLKGINSAHPHLKLDVSILGSSHIQQRMTQDPFDIAIYFRLCEPTGAARTHERILRTEDTVWVRHKDLLISADQPLPLLTLPPGCMLQSRAAQLLESANIRYQRVHSASSVAGLLSAVQAGLGVTCINHSAITAEMRRIDELPALPELPKMALCISCNHPEKAGASELVELIHTLCADLEHTSFGKVGNIQ